MMAGSNTASSGKPPVAPDLDSIFNRINMGMAKHSRILNTLKKPSAPATTTPAPSSSSSSDQTDPNPSTSTTDKKSFSSLSTTTLLPKPSPKAIPNPHQFPPKKDDDDDLNPYDTQPPNAGIGWAPAPSGGDGTARSARAQEVDRLLKSQLLGGRKGMAASAAAKEQLLKRGRNAARQRERQDESEDEEAGRGAVGRERRGVKRVKRAVEVGGGRAGIVIPEVVVVVGTAVAEETGEKKDDGLSGVRDGVAVAAAAVPATTTTEGTEQLAAAEKGVSQTPVAAAAAAVATAAAAREAEALTGPERRKQKKREKKKSKRLEGAGAGAQATV